MSSLVLQSSELEFVNGSNLPEKHGIFSVTEYIRYVNSIPVLTEDEEKFCIENYKNNNDQSSRNKLILAHLRIVVKIANQFSKKANCSMMELISEGNYGLMIALEKFDLSKGFRFVTYAFHWVKAHIKKYLTQSWSVVKNSVKGIMKTAVDSENNGKFFTLSDSVISSNDGNAYSDFASSFNILEEIDNENKTKQMYAAIAKLTDREKYVLHKRVFAHKIESLEEISKALSISKERVRQIYEESVNKIRRFCKK